MAMKRRSMKKAMKARKARKAMKSRKARKSMKKRGRKAKKVSIIARNKYAKLTVFRGTAGKQKTQGGLTKADLKKNKNGKIVSKKQSARGQKNKWAIALNKARKALGIKGFQAIGGKSAKGQALLKKTRSFYKH
jgi:hypothetical protein